MGENVTFPISRAKNGFKSKGFQNVLILTLVSLVFSVKIKLIAFVGGKPFLNIDQICLLFRRK